jgi:HSP20 family protein
VRADVPGVKKEDIKITYTDGTVSIAAERKDEKREDDQEHKRFFSEVSYGKFFRSFRVGPPSDDAGMGRAGH